MLGYFRAIILRAGYVRGFIHKGWMLVFEAKWLQLGHDLNWKSEQHFRLQSIDKAECLQRQVIEPGFHVPVSSS